MVVVKDTFVFIANVIMKFSIVMQKSSIFLQVLCLLERMLERKDFAKCLLTI